MSFILTYALQWWRAIILPLLKFFIVLQQFLIVFVKVLSPYTNELVFNLVDLFEIFNPIASLNLINTIRVFVFAACWTIKLIVSNEHAIGRLSGLLPATSAQLRTVTPQQILNDPNKPNAARLSALNLFDIPTIRTQLSALIVGTHRRRGESIFRRTGNYLCKFKLSQFHWYANFLTNVSQTAMLSPRIKFRYHWNQSNLEFLHVTLFWELHISGIYFGEISANFQQK